MSRTVVGRRVGHAPCVDAGVAMTRTGPGMLHASTLESRWRGVLCVPAPEQGQNMYGTAHHVSVRS